MTVGTVRTTAEVLAEFERRSVDDRSPSAHVERLLDEGTFSSLPLLPAESADNGPEGFGTSRARGAQVAVGHGEIDGRPVCVFSVSADERQAGITALSRFEANMICRVIDMATATGVPLVGVYASTATDESVDSAEPEPKAPNPALDTWSPIAHRLVRASGVIPQLTVVLDVIGESAALPLALTDFTAMVDGSAFFATDPETLKVATGSDPTTAALGNADIRTSVDGTAHFLAADVERAFDWIRDIVAHLPQNSIDPAPELTGSPVPEPEPALNTLIPDSPGLPFDMRSALTAIVDDGEIVEVHELFAPNIIVGFGRVDGTSVGLVANQSQHLGGALDIAATEKAARFVRFCDSFSLPIITLVDCPGFLPDVDQEAHGAIRAGAKLLYAYGEATCPLITVLTRRAFGTGLHTMAAKGNGADVCLAWPTAQVKSHGTHADGPFVAAGSGTVDAVIRPEDTPTEVAAHLRLLVRKRDSLPPKKHGNPPL